MTLKTATTALCLLMLSAPCVLMSCADASEEQLPEESAQTEPDASEALAASPESEEGEESNQRAEGSDSEVLDSGNEADASGESLSSDAEAPEADSSEPEPDAEGPMADTQAQSFTLESPDFEEGGEMPDAFVCCKGNPSLSWSGVPEGTLSLVLIYDDPDAADFDHWALYNIPPELLGLDANISGKTQEAALPEGAQELDSGFGFSGYLGPCPPAEHTYRWRLWALSGVIEEAPADFAALELAADALSLGVAELSQTFGPKTPEQGATCD